jgi:uncharacterized protein (DUF58 family)
MASLPLEACWLQAAATAHALGPLLLGARARSVQHSGSHGQRRSGRGQDFWQYRALSPNEAARQIDWRRSGRSDALFAREQELDRPARLLLWIDDSPSMHYASTPKLMSKVAAATHLGLSVGIAALNAEESVSVPPGRRIQNPQRLGAAFGEQVLSLAAFVEALQAGQGCDLLWISDFIGQDALCAAIHHQALTQGARLHFLQVLDPAEATFPFRGACHFEGLEGEAAFVTLEATTLQTAYLAALDKLSQSLASAAQASGGSYHRFLTTPQGHEPMQHAALPVLRQLAYALASPA